jgi:hypothetical protein
MFVAHLLPIAAWVRTPCSVIFLIVVVVIVATWLPLVLGAAYENWRDLAQRVRRGP